MPARRFLTTRRRAPVFHAHRHARARIARDLPRALPDEVSSGAVMSGPVSCHLPVDASLHSFNSLDYGFGTGESPFLAGSSDATCGAAAVRAVSQYLNLEPMRAVVSFADTPGQLAQPAPSEALVARERDAARGDRPWEEQQLGVDELTASGRTGAVEDVSTSHDVAEVRLGLFRTPHTRGAPSIRGFDAHATARAAFSGRAPDRDSSFSPAPRPTHPAGFLSPELRRLGRRTTGGRAVQQGTSSLRLRLPAIAPNAAATDARASARRLVFGKREHVTSCFDRRKHAPLTPFSSTPRAPRSSATRNRDRCARSPRARSRRFSMNPTSARTRYVPAPRTSRDTPRTPVSSFETNPSRSPNLAPEKRAWRRAVDARRPTRAPHVAHFRIGTLFRFSDNVSIRRRSVFARARGDALDRSFPRSFPRSVCCAPLRLDAPRIVIDHARELTITRAPERRARRNGRRSRICRRCRAT